MATSVTPSLGRYESSEGVQSVLPSVTTTLQGRAYQLEMLEESMKRNIIIAAETGSGKTLIAILRIQAELERCPPEKFVWFCVPTVELATQQHRAISTQLPAFQARVLSGADNVDHWTNQWIWDEVLKGIRIVVTTHQVLYDALSHGFVGMNKIALMVFDEAHSCIGNHASSRILLKFYHETRVKERPAILGLTASPVINDKVGNLDKLESTLNAIARTPKLNRAEMLQYVHKPKPIKLIYMRKGPEAMISEALQSLRSVFERLDIMQDPWIIKMQSNPIACESEALNKAIMRQKTYCHDQIKGLYNRAMAIDTELGPTATDYYIHECIEKFQRGTADGSFMIEGFEDDERRYLREKFSKVHIPNLGADSLVQRSVVTPKLRTLIEYLLEEEAQGFSGLIFVRTRAEVAVLSHMLTLHVPKFTISTFVGASSFSGRTKAITELAEVKNQRHTLDDLRQGKNHIVVTTNALEEGIDVAACNVVICFDPPPNLKSFIQRRGRARKSISKFVLMFEEGPSSRAILTWEELEAEMTQIYEDDMRALEEAKALEEQEEEGRRELFNETTGAKLTLEDAVQHLHHFCATLPAAPYVDLRPLFIFEEHSTAREGQDKSISAKVILPNSVDSTLREACSSRQWKTEKMARRDAAFEAYTGLYYAGLVNEHFLPVGHVDEGADEAYQAIEKRPSLVEVSDQFYPWTFLAQQWGTTTNISALIITVEQEDHIVASMTMLLPQPLPKVADFELYWDANTIFKVSISPSSIELDLTVIAPATQITSLILQSIFQKTMDPGQRDFTALFLPNGVADFSKWVETNTGVVRLDHVCEDGLGEGAGLLRDLTQNRLPYVFRNVMYASIEDLCPDGSMDIDGYSDKIREHREMSFKEALPKGKGPDCERVVNEDTNTETCVLIETTRLAKKVDFLHRPSSQNAKIAKASRVQLLLAQQCEMDRLPFKYSRFAMLVPSILHRVQAALVVDQLCETILSPLQFNDRELVEAAISAPSAQELTDYNRLEFLGDSFLKFFTSLTMMAKHLRYHEGILAHQKDHIVSNGRLALAAIYKGVNQFILTKAFTGLKWRPPYNSELLNDQPSKKREMSTKTLADVVEALIGAAYCDGGPEKALQCLEQFLPDVPWSTALGACEILYSVYQVQTVTSNQFDQLEQLISYKFNLKALLIEALTHPSHHGPNTSASYERLEFLGDSVLDNIVTTTAFAHKPSIATHGLHLIRAALVNGNFLGYLCLTLFTTLQRFDPVSDDPKNIRTNKVSYPFYLWQAMRHASPAVREAQQACLARLSFLKDEISETLTAGKFYPWRLFARLEPPKFISDIVESVLGAIYIDTHGSLDICQSFLEHLGLMTYLHRVMQKRTALLHPKEELGQLADREKVRYVLGKEGKEEERRLTCTIIVGERELVRVGDGFSPMEVQTRAADEACKIMRAEGRKARGGRGSGDDDLKGEAVGEEEPGEEEEREVEGVGVGVGEIDERDKVTDEDRIDLQTENVERQTGGIEGLRDEERLEDMDVDEQKEEQGEGDDEGQGSKEREVNMEGTDVGEETSRMEGIEDDSDDEYMTADE